MADREADQQKRAALEVGLRLKASSKSRPIQPFQELVQNIGQAFPESHDQA